MCGLAGFIDVNTSLPASELSRVLGQMGDSLYFRGPDDSGQWLDAEAGIGLVHRRLSILDLTAAGHQPMVSASGRFVLAFNGEIYNHLELRRTLEQSSGECGLQWRGHSDTETLLNCVEAWGFETALQKSTGMFAIALWDRSEHALYLARDRMGEKPLYYGWQGGALLFGSELKALKKHPSFRSEIDRGALTQLLRHCFIPAPHSIYHGIQKLPAGCYLRLKSGDTRQSNHTLPRPTMYWSLSDAVLAGSNEPFRGTDEEAVTGLEERLQDSIGLQMVADVPLGAFLSGGLDSSTVVALMQAQSGRPVKTFTMGFYEADYNEAEHAKAVARHLGTDHTELYVTPGVAIDVIPRLPMLYDEPFADPSQIPTFLLSEMAGRHVTVSLSGDGGDELFGGYNRYFWGAYLWRRLKILPKPVRSALAGLLTTLSPSRWDSVFARIPALIPDRLLYNEAGNKLHRMAEVINFKSSAEIYRRLLSHWEHPCDVILNAVEPPTMLTDPAHWSLSDKFENQMMYLDALMYLPDDILVKVDRAAMGVSLETRVPMLDHRVVEYAWRLPLSMKVRNGQGKWILRQVLEKYVPKTLTDRPKMGFGVPIDSWLRGPLRDWAEALLDESRLRREGFFNPAPIRQKWEEHLSGQNNWQYHLWDVLMFQAWLEQQS